MLNCMQTDVDWRVASTTMFLLSAQFTEVAGSAQEQVQAIETLIDTLASTKQHCGEQGGQRNAASFHHGCAVELRVVKAHEARGRRLNVHALPHIHVIPLLIQAAPHSKVNILRAGQRSKGSTWGGAEVHCHLRTVSFPPRVHQGTEAESTLPLCNTASVLGRFPSQP